MWDYQLLLEAVVSAQTIDFWFSIGSTYTYLTVMRLGDIAKVSGLTFRWRPFGGVLAVTGATELPFLEGSAKARYMWRDIERRAARYGVPVQLPIPYPCPHSQQARLVTLVGLREGWGEQFVRASYVRWFQHGEASGSDPNLRAALAACNQDVDRVMAQAGGEEFRRELDDATDEARRIGLFGSPSFVVSEEIFWGDDRLEDA